MPLPTADRHIEVSASSQAKGTVSIRTSTDAHAAKAALTRVPLSEEGSASVLGAFVDRGTGGVKPLSPSLAVGMCPMAPYRRRGSRGALSIYEVAIYTLGKALSMYCCGVNASRGCSVRPHDFDPE